MSDTANNEAKIVISTDPAQFVKFMTDAARAFRDLEKEGKKSVGALDISFQSLGKGMARFGADIAKNVLGTALAPMQQAMAQALGNARTWRQESTRIMGATGEDWQKIGAQIDTMSAKTGRLPGDVANYADSIRELTGDWKTATEGAEDYSNLARYLGRRSISEMAPLATMMDNIFGVKGQGNAQNFFDAAVRGAEKLGQNGVKLLGSFERVAGMGVLQAPGGKAGQGWAKENLALLTALQNPRFGLNQPQAEAAYAEIAGKFSQDPNGFQMQLRNLGILKENQSIMTAKGFGQLKYSYLQLLGMMHQQSKRYTKGLGGNQAKWDKLLLQNFGGALAGAVMHYPEIMEDAKAALEAGAAGGPSPIGARAEKVKMTPEYQRVISDLMLQKKMRDSKGAALLSVEDYQSRMSEATPDKDPFQQSLIDAAETAGEVASVVSPAIGAGISTGAAVYGQSPNMKPAQGMRAGKYGNLRDEGEGAGGSFWQQLLGTQRQQPKEIADALKDVTLKVRIIEPGRGKQITGGGNQVN